MCGSRPAPRRVLDADPQRADRDLMITSFVVTGPQSEALAAELREKQPIFPPLGLVLVFISSAGCR